MSDLTHRLTVVRWQLERRGTLLSQPKIRITYGPFNPALNPTWLDLNQDEADILAEILGQLTPNSTAGLIAGLYEFA
ncbi:hypothetical protein GCM10022419_007820 [Nonomuraea rosea]|uniref:Uncharacterized protein n=1 Tax=Nonomuraea rosea TaxID=638574 RepID=A0ABP6V8Y7_9ACTN